MADENLKHKHSEIKKQTLEVGIINAASQQSSGRGQAVIGINYLVRTPMVAVVSTRGGGESRQ